MWFPGISPDLCRVTDLFPFPYIDMMQRPWLRSFGAQEAMEGTDISESVGYGRYVSDFFLYMRSKPQHLDFLGVIKLLAHILKGWTPKIVPWVLGSKGQKIKHESLQYHNWRIE